jgi:hypothetical protein
MIGVAVLGATDAADEMAGHLRHRHAFGQIETAGVDIADIQPDFSLPKLRATLLSVDLKTKAI